MKRIAFLLVWFLFFHTGSAQTLAERLGYQSTDRLLIVNCDDAGMCEAANKAALDGIKNGMITSTTIMMPCPRAEEMVGSAIRDTAIDAGVHLTHTSEWQTYRWGSVAPPEKVRGLLDPGGFLWRSIEEVYTHSNPVEAYREAKAQILKAMELGLAITHIDSHMGTLQLSPPYVDVYLQLASEFDVPVRMASQETLEKFGQPEIRKNFAEKGILFPDYFIYEELDHYTEDDIKSFWSDIIHNLKPGITELFIHASVPDEELKSITNSWKTRNAEYELFANDEEFREFLKKENIILIGYRPLLELQRKRGK
jgi:chitin disaccharide deacetylase